MAIRKDGIIINDELTEKLNTMSFSNDTNQTYSVEEVYVAKVINDNSFNFNNLKSSYIFDINDKCVRLVVLHNDKIICYNSEYNNKVEIDINKALILPTWQECREWLKNNNYKMEFHYDPFREGQIKLGFMKPKFFSGVDNIVVEAQGRTDLEAIYKVILEVVKYENSLTA